MKTENTQWAVKDENGFIVDGIALDIAKKAVKRSICLKTLNNGKPYYNGRSWHLLLDEELKCNDRTGFRNAIAEEKEKDDRGIRISRKTYRVSWFGVRDVVSDKQMKILWKNKNFKWVEKGVEIILECNEKLTYNATVLYLKKI